MFRPEEGRGSERGVQKNRIPGEGSPPVTESCWSRDRAGRGVLCTGGSGQDSRKSDEAQTRFEETTALRWAKLATGWGRRTPAWELRASAHPVPAVHAIKKKQKTN